MTKSTKTNQDSVTIPAVGKSTRKARKQKGDKSESPKKDKGKTPAVSTKAAAAAAKKAAKLAEAETAETAEKADADDVKDPSSEEESEDEDTDADSVKSNNHSVASNASGSGNSANKAKSPEKGADAVKGSGTPINANKKAAAVAKPVTTGHVLDSASSFVSLSKNSIKKLSTNGIWGDQYKRINADPDLKGELAAIVDLALELAGFELSDVPNTGKTLFAKQLAASHLSNFTAIGAMHSKAIMTGYPCMEGVLKNAICKIGTFLRIDTKERVLATLGKDHGDITVEMINFVCDSYERLPDIEFTLHDFKQVPTPSEVNFFVFKSMVVHILKDNNMTHLLDDNLEVQEGECFFENRHLARMLEQRCRRTAIAHITAGTTENGAKAFKDLIDAFLPPSKLETMLRKLEKDFDDILLLRVEDIHLFFTVTSWYIQAHNDLVNDATLKWDKAKMDERIKLQLKSSKQHIGSKETNLLNTIGLFDNGSDVDKVKAKLYELFSDSKLLNTGNGLPKGFFPDHANINHYQRALKAIMDGGKVPPVPGSKADVKLRKLQKVYQERGDDASNAEGEDSPAPAPGGAKGLKRKGKGPGKVNWADRNKNKSKRPKK